MSLLYFGLFITAIPSGVVRLVALLRYLLAYFVPQAVFISSAAAHACGVIFSVVVVALPRVLVELVEVNLSLWCHLTRCTPAWNPLSSSFRSQPDRSPSFPSSFRCRS